MTIATVFLLSLYIGGVLTLGFAAHRRSQQTIEDYFLVSRGVGLLFLVGTIVATMINSLALTGVPALLYEGGVLFGQMVVAVLGSMALMWIFGPRVCQLAKEKGFVTPGELFAAHYQSRSVLVLVVAFGLLSIFPLLAIQLAGMGKIVAVTTGGTISQEFAVVLCTLSVGIYTFLGGARASIWTDALQGLIILGVFTGLAALFSVWIGGLSAGIEKLHQVMPEKLVFNDANTPVFIDNILSWTFAFFLWPHIFQRMFMARTPSSVRRSASISLVVFLYLFVCLLIMAIAATAEFYGSINDPDQLIATMLNKHLPVGGVVLTVLVFALVMSTIDSMLLALSSIVTRDVWKGLLHNEGHPSSVFKRGRWITLILLILASLFAMTTIGRGALTPWVTLGASIATLLLWPFLGIFVFKGASKNSVIAAMCLGFLTLCLMRFTALGNLLPIGFATAGFLVAAVTFLIVGLVAPTYQITATKE